MPVLYDRDCGFCRFSIGLLLAWDRRRRLRPVAIQSDEGQRLLADLPPDERLASAHAIDADGRLRSGGAAAAPIAAAACRAGRPLARARRAGAVADRARLPRGGRPPELARPAAARRARSAGRTGVIAERGRLD